MEFLIALIGLGVAIDYSLLVVTRWREERAHGYDNHEAVARAMNSAGRAVVFSGLTVGISLLALVVLPVSFLANIGVAGFLIPDRLGGGGPDPAAGPAGQRRSVPGPAPAAPGGACQPAVDGMGSPGAAVPASRAAVVGAGILIALIIPVFALNLGEPKTSALAQTGDGPRHTLPTLQAGGVPIGCHRADGRTGAGRPGAHGGGPAGRRSRGCTRPPCRTAPTFTEAGHDHRRGAAVR